MSSSRISQQRDMDSTSSIKARREYIHAGSTPASMRVTALTEEVESIAYTLMRQQ